jgi:hypothetical protein
MSWCRSHPRSKTYSSVFPFGLLFSSSASSESIGSSSPTWPEVITMSALAGSLLSAMMLPAAKYLVVLLRMSWRVFAYKNSYQTG